MAVATAIVGTAAAFGYVDWRFGQINKVSVGSLAAAGAGAPFTLLVVGSDSRSALKGADNQQFGSSEVTPGQRSDTIILVRVVPRTRQMTILSIPRDLWVPVRGLGNQRINAAFDSGANLLVSTIESDLGIPVNHFVEVNFDSFRQITDAVGGVRFYFPTPAKDTFSLLNVPAAGCITLTGDQALAFVRSRHYEYYQNGEWNYEAESDLARIQRQQAFIKKMIKKAEGSYSNPLALNAIIGGVTKNLTVDSAFSRGLMVALARDFRSVNAAGIPNETLPTFNENVGGAEVLGLQQPQAAQMISAFNSLGVQAPAAKTIPSPPPTSIAPGSVSIEVVNGSGVSGQAGSATSALQGLGYSATVGASSGYGYTTSVVRYAPDSLAAARQLASELAGGATLEADSALTPTSYNLELVTGSDYSGLVGARSSSPAASSTSTSSTTPPATPAVYELPGFQPSEAAAAAACR